ncbi:hypothetical protein PR202_ga17675 [Eleusine coracana subsp. coracana]|uniref:Uncharacterized protein n=1 Tax=Eleusine coracana subsp. coracana TaxID=191504 RepID=A0AAV5CP17_ELECO|nr:hypothetical protein PR202_ga17428 [Eleusine coracana subsp. coracana]GJN00489.1 hypothetical protein PR202_ga17675 [Eleusine coracana subsp. coracana]
MLGMATVSRSTLRRLLFTLRTRRRPSREPNTESQNSSLGRSVLLRKELWEIRTKRAISARDRLRSLSSTMRGPRLVFTSEQRKHGSPATTVATSAVEKPRPARTASGLEGDLRWEIILGGEGARGRGDGRGGGGEAVEREKGYVGGGTAGWGVEEEREDALPEVDHGVVAAALAGGKGEG